MKLLVVCCLLFVVSGSYLAQESREKKLEQLKSRTDIKVTEIEKDILKLEYSNGKVLYKNIGDYKHPESSIQRPAYSPTFDSTIIDLTTIDTTLYHYKYKFWQEVPISNGDFDYLRITDVNNNGKPELYGFQKFFWSDFKPVTVYEINQQGSFDSLFQYDSIYITRNIYDVNKDGQLEVVLLGNLYDERFFSKESDSSLATIKNFSFNPFEFPTQLDDPTLGDFDADNNTDMVFDRLSPPFVYIFEFNPLVNNFDSVYRFQVPDPIDLGIGGYSVGDFDLDGKTDIIFSTVRGKVFVVENEGDNQYTVVWEGSVQSNNAYIHTWTNDIDKNGKPEFWVLADAYYNGIGTTRVTIFETNGDNSYDAVGRVDLVGVFSFYAGNMQAIEIDGDGTEEIAVCIDQNFLILKFDGNENQQVYGVYYIKQNELAASGQNSVYFGATVYDLKNNNDKNILISLDQAGGKTGRRFTQIYEPDSVSIVHQYDDLTFKTTTLHQNYPNPFNPSTKICFEIDRLSYTSIKVFNIIGEEITSLLNKELTPGRYTIDWEAKDSNGQLLPSGVYLIKLTAGKYIQTIKTLLLK